MKIKPIIMHENLKKDFFYIADLKFRSMIFTHGSYNYRIDVYYFFISNYRHMVHVGDKLINLIEK